MEKYRLEITKMFEEHNLVAVTYEISLPRGVHPHWQVLPISSLLQGKVGSLFKERAAENFYDLVEREVKSGENSYFRLRWNNHSLVQDIAEGKYFNLQFPRQVLAELLELEARSNWKLCIQSEEEEIKDADAFRTVWADRI